MTKNEIKKELYKQKPTAHFIMILNSEAYYETSLKDGTIVPFTIPVSDMGEARFMSQIEAYLLNRWIND